MATMLVLLRELAERLNEEHLPVTGTATSGTSTTLVDTTEPGLYYSDSDANLLDRWFVYNELAGATGRVDVSGLAGSTGTLTLTGGEFGAEGTGTGAVTTTTSGGVGTLTDTRVSWVTNQWVGATVTCNTKVMTVTSNDSDTLTSTTDWDASPGNGNSWAMTGVCPYILVPNSPLALKKAINVVLRNMYVPHLWAPSLVPDDNLEDSDPTAYWNQVGTIAGGVATYNTTAANVLFGERSLTFAAAAGVNGLVSDLIDMNPSETLLVSAFVRNAGPKQLTVALLGTSGTTILDSAIPSSQAWTEARFSYTWTSDELTSTTDAARLAFLATETTTGVYISPPIIVQSASRRTYNCPSWLTRESQVEGMYYRPGGVAAEATETYMALSSSSQARAGLNFLQSGRDVTPLRIEFEPDLSLGPVFLECLRPFAELSADSDTTNADTDKVIDFAADLILNPEEGHKRLRNHVYAVLTQPSTHVPPRVGVSIR